MERAAPRHLEQVRERAVRVKLRGEDPAGLTRRTEHHGPGGVAEQHARIPVRPVDDLGKRLDSDHQHRLRRARGDLRARERERVEESRARRRDVEGVRLLGAQPVLHEARGRGKRAVSRHGADDDLVDLRAVDARVLQGAPGRLGRQRRSRRVRIGDPALLDSGPGGDPLVGGVHDLLQILVREHPVGRAGAYADDVHVARRSDHAASGASRCRSSRMKSATRASAQRAAARMAFLMARALLRPCAMMQVPSTPRSGAPPTSA